MIYYTDVFDDDHRYCFHEKHPLCYMYNETVKERTKQPNVICTMKQ